jgi:hypothetical protein
VGTVVAQMAEAIIKAWSSAVAAQTLARSSRPVLHGHTDEQPAVVTIDLDRLDLERDGRSASAE